MSDRRNCQILAAGWNPSRHLSTNPRLIVTSLGALSEERLRTIANFDVRQFFRDTTDDEAFE
jgi:hypothetical protein